MLKYDPLEAKDNAIRLKHSKNALLGCLCFAHGGGGGASPSPVDRHTTVGSAGIKFMQWQRRTMPLSSERVKCDVVKQGKDLRVTLHGREGHKFHIIIRQKITFQHYQHLLVLQTR